jgi:hypothetical protein
LQRLVAAKTGRRMGYGSAPTRNDPLTSAYVVMACGSEEWLIPVGADLLAHHLLEQQIKPTSAWRSSH